MRFRNFYDYWQRTKGGVQDIEGQLNYGENPTFYCTIQQYVCVLICVKINIEQRIKRWKSTNQGEKMSKPWGSGWSYQGFRSATESALS